MTAQNEDDMIKRRIGSRLDELLHEDGVLELATATAITRVTAWQAGRVTREAELAALEQAGHALGEQLEPGAGLAGASLKQAGQTLDEQLASRGVDPEAVVAEFEQTRKAGRLQPGDPHDKKTR